MLTKALSGQAMKGARMSADLAEQLERKFHNLELTAAPSGK